MGTVGFYIGFGLLVLIGGAVALFFWGQKRARKNAYLSYADSLGFSAAYKKSVDYQLKGNYRGYAYDIAPFFPESLRRDEWVKMNVPMINPNKMYLRIAKGVQGQPWFDSLAQEEAIQVAHDMGTQAELMAGNIFFSSLLLTDEMKERIRQVFSLIQEGVVYIKDDHLSAILPEGISKPEGRKKYKEVMNLLADIKDELNK